MSTSPASAVLASEAGFTGTLRELFEWVSSQLCHGYLEISRPWAAGYSLPKITVRTVSRRETCDEQLLARVHEIPEVEASWHSAFVGGLRVYQFDAAVFEGGASVTLPPVAASSVLEFGRIRKVRVVSPRGAHVEVLEGYDCGVHIEVSDPSAEVLILKPAAASSL